MKRKMSFLNNAIALLLVALVYHQTCLAQVNPWERVKLIEPGKSVHVKLHSGKTVKGKMESWNADELSVRQGNGKVVEVAKSDVAQVATATGISRGRKALYTVLVAGGAIQGTAAAGCAASGCADVPAAAIAASAAAGGVLVAVGLTGLLRQHTTVIYKAEFTPSAGGCAK